MEVLFHICFCRCFVAKYNTSTKTYTEENLTSVHLLSMEKEFVHKKTLATRQGPFKNATLAALTKTSSVLVYAVLHFYISGTVTF